MFNSKLVQLGDNDNKSNKTSESSSFIDSAMKESAKTLSGNDALKYSTTGNDFVDQFSKLGSYKVPRTYDEIATDMSVLWAKDKNLAVKFVLYLRTISRKTQLINGVRTETIQRGAGLKHEAMIRFMWLFFKDKNVFYENLHLFVSVGSWKDIFNMLSYDLIHNDWNNRQLDWDFLGKFILAGLENPSVNNLIKKYLPSIKAKSKCKSVESQARNMIGKWISSLLFGLKSDSSNYKLYRKLKTSGTAHEWQKQISKGEFLNVNFDTIAGRALAQIVSGKFLENHDLEKKYETWIESKPIAKFTGFVHELFKRIPTKKYEIDTINKQFDGLVKTAKENATTDTSMIVVRDTSGSMGSEADGTKQTCFDVAKATALYFNEMLPDGKFANNWIEFSNIAKMHEWKGETVLEKWVNDKSSVVGSTNFQSVFELFVNLKLKENVSEEEFPSGIICISDSEFNPSGNVNSWYDTNEPDMYTNYNTGIEKLRKAGFSDEYCNNFKVVLWNLQSKSYGEDTGKKFETHGETKNVFYFSGYDASVMAFLTGVEHQETQPKTDVELMMSALDQEVLNLVQVK